VVLLRLYEAFVPQRTLRGSPRERMGIDHRLMASTIALGLLAVNEVMVRPDAQCSPVSSVPGDSTTVHLNSCYWH
jgi:hypothetical protein